MDRQPAYEVAVIGGGPAGLTAALYATRLGHRTALITREGGRHELVDSVHNLIGVSEETSGAELAAVAAAQLEEYGTDYYEDSVTALGRADDDRFRIEATHADLLAERVVLATGFSDNAPRVPDLQRFTGHGLHYCLHCDAYTLADAPVFVLGHDEEAAHVAMTLLNFTGEVDLILNGERPTWGDDTATQVETHPVEVLSRSVNSAFAESESTEAWIGGLEFADGTEREYVGGFAVYGREYNAALAEDLGCELNDDGSVAVDEDFETSVDGVYAVGDVTHGQNQTPVAVGDGARAGIAVHHDLRRFPLSAEECADRDPGDLSAPAVADDLRARMRRHRSRDDYAGMTPDGS
ncbi:NAD(P)/FAD-dependent oxidoreductase [Halostella sp. JP-L12]|uniref:NAD(P)/FAD-dependent oxidoreductase n=1 Tax=Halostella TaxID=1843185 RepID=UPI000EF7B6DE|nr:MULTISPECIES: NAD(P)/FAD-dependent oxidoreductase [Halostella]NHN47160.1 NAD(P)/FAD-dependent oxidoreductase [Halostella sp. JP-L12]